MVKMTPSEVWEARVRRSGEAVAGSFAGWVDDVAARDRIILDAIDGGCRALDVARWAGLSKQRVTQIVAVVGAG